MRRSYVSLTCGVPSLKSGRVEIPIGRDPRDRKKMAAISASGSSAGRSKSRTAASRSSFFQLCSLAHKFSQPVSLEVLIRTKSC